MSTPKATTVSTPKSAPTVQMEDASVKAASENERKKIATNYGRNNTSFGSGVLSPTSSSNAKTTLG